MDKLTEYTAPWIIAFQGGEHRVLKNGAVVVEGNRIVHVGEKGKFSDAEVVETNSIIAPGFISMHSHMQESPVDKGIAEDMDKRQFWNTNLIEVLPPRSKALTEKNAHTCARVSLAEHLRTGCTTVMQMGIESDYIANLARDVGVRAYISEAYRSGEWLTTDGRNVTYKWSDDDGAAAFERAQEFALNHRNSDGSDLVTGFLNPSQVDTCSEDLLKETKAFADENGLLMQIHAAQSYSEFHEMTRRHAKTPIEWLYDIGFVGDNVIIGHGLFLAGTSLTNFHGDDLALLAETDTSVVYNPWVFARNGIVMESFERYTERGVRVCLGTDTTTQSMMHSARYAALITKIVDRRADVGSAASVFNASTVVAADVLGRSDLGRVEKGAKADLVFWKTDSLYMTPLRDPIRSIIYYSEVSDVDRVMVDGKFVLQDGRVDGLNEKQDLTDLQALSEGVWESWHKYDWADRSIDTHVPLSFPEFVVE
ncbi:amidohydrolase family protein [Brevibacterium luteolum]|uniref:Amidohydrolase n=1 Tax=Brevibacterium luteolum TaxID=199591 RepID=A0A6G8KVH1_9MICO|nr:amidohydrolase family protein [Brevibacterium luteolum]QIN28824.1 amidohydrolase [Brevibacterium luteolum]